jgi:hypothetical protein
VPAPKVDPVGLARLQPTSRPIDMNTIVAMTKP